MRILELGTKEHTEIRVCDERGSGYANHHYEIIPVGDTERTAPFCCVNFQNGPIKENGVNGIHNEDLLCIVADRLIGFEAGRFACDENAAALKAVMYALSMLRIRTEKRKTRGVEGTNVK